jgi:hypothetical protein
MLFVQVISGGTVNSVTQFKISFHGIAAKVKVPVLHPDVVAAIRIVLDGKRGYG